MSVVASLLVIRGVADCLVSTPQRRVDLSADEERRLRRWPSDDPTAVFLIRTWPALFVRVAAAPDPASLGCPAAGSDLAREGRRGRKKEHFPRVGSKAQRPLVGGGTTGHRGCARRVADGVREEDRRGDHTPSLSSFAAIVPMKWRFSHLRKKEKKWRCSQTLSGTGPSCLLTCLLWSSPNLVQSKFSWVQALCATHGSRRQKCLAYGDTLTWSTMRSCVERRKRRGMSCAQWQRQQLTAPMESLRCSQGASSLPMIFSSILQKGTLVSVQDFCPKITQAKSAKPSSTTILLGTAL
nr:uncharacterized protein LOC127314652 isoform X2 [Lolium perenne]XP_051201119.1 uncharacterized protein LOC127314652 isoform X4 [Lolium perenne]